MKVHNGLLVCEECGTPHEEFTEYLNHLEDQARLVGELQAQVEQLQENRELAEADLRGKRSLVKKLRKEQDKKARENKFYDDAMEILEFWREVCHPSAKELEGERLQKVLARLQGRPRAYTKDELKRCVLGYSKFPYVVATFGRRAHGSPGQRRVDAELVFRDPKHVDQGLALADQAGIPPLCGKPVEAPKDPTPAQEPEQLALAQEEALSDFGEAAVMYASWSWMVFPCQVNGKPPKTPHGLLDASSDVMRIKRYWKRVQNANVAIRTGRETGLVVLDVDGEGGFESLRELETRFEKLPTTRTVVTPRKGQHFYFLHPGEEIRNTQGIPGPGLDMRGDGGYVLAPPSLVDGKRYEVDDEADPVAMPVWLFDVIQKHLAKTNGRTDPKVWENMVQMGVREGERNGQLTRLAGYLLNHLPDTGVILGIVKNTNRERCRPPLADREVERIVDSLIRIRVRKAREALAANKDG